MTDTARRYDIEQVLGRGGFGTVYRARMSSSGGFSKHVALKVLNPDVASTADVIQRLRDEARMLGLLRHRAIVQVEGLVHLDDRWAVVMEFVDGASLSELARMGPLPPSVALEVGEEVSTALEVAFSHPASNGEVLRLLHRDIKPSNVQLTARGEVKLLDFGVARADFGGREAHTRSLILGSIDYLAPERLEMIDSHKGDIYALGATIFELLAGEPFGRASVNPRRHATQLDERLAARIAPLGDPELVALLRSALAYDDADRPDAAALSRSLRDLRRHHPEPWMRDWANEAVPRAQARRSPDSDDWSGATLREGGGSETIEIDLSTSDLEPPPPRPEPPSPRPEARAGRPEPELPRPKGARSHLDGRATGGRSAAPARRPRSAWRTCGVVALLGGGLAVVAVVLVTILIPTALVALLSGTGIWAAAWEDSVKDGMAKQALAVGSLAPSAERDRVLAVLTQAQEPVHAREIGFWELVAFDILLDEAMSDRHLTPGEADKIEARYRKIIR
jgi:serine/threonine protein kinase